MTEVSRQRGIAALRRVLSSELSLGNEGYKLDVGLLEAVFDEGVERARLAQMAGVDLTRDPHRRLEHVMLRFAAGARAALRDEGIEPLVSALEAVPADFRGFAYEGAAQGLILLDHRAPGPPRRVAEWLSRTERAHPYLVAMGVGAGPILQRRYDELMGLMTPAYRYAALDGYGFREGYIYRARRVVRMEAFDHPDPHARHMFDRGLGRSLWFLFAAEVDAVVGAVRRFPEERADAMWAGLGFVCVFTGSCSPQAAEELTRAAGASRGALAEGAAFAAHARSLAGTGDALSEGACRGLTGLSVEGAASLVAHALAELPGGADGRTAHAGWSARVRTLISEAGNRDRAS